MLGAQKLIKIFPLRRFSMRTQTFPTIKTVANKPNTILYHGNCPDGFGAAFAAWKFLGCNATYVPVTHAELPDCTGKHVAVFDFCWHKEQLRAIKSQTASFVLLDHHISAMKENEDEAFCYFDMEKSGAVLAWEFFFPDQPVPKLIQYIQDRDLWTWKMPDSKAFCVAHDLHPYEFEVWDKLLDDDAIALQREQGKILLQYQTSLVESIAKKAYKINWSGKRVYTVNSTIFASDIGNCLSSRQDCDFAVIWNYDQAAGLYKVSLRSADDENDVSIIAQQFGGGGHRRAAGLGWKGNSIDDLFNVDLNL